MKKIQCPTVVYDPTINYEGGQGGLRIYLPYGERCVNYTLIHTVVAEKNVDIWRMSVAFETDEFGNTLRQLTKDRAEWDMAIRLSDRPDFIGGYNHGDEHGDPPTLWINGIEALPESLTEPLAFKELKMQIRSIGYDPKSQSDAVFEHEKVFCFTECGVDLSQKITWLGQYELDKKFKSYLAMMPPLKHDPENPEIIITDTYYTDQLPQTAIEILPVVLGKATEYNVRGTKSGLTYTMRVRDYHPLYQNSYQATLSDNNGGNYHKMYIAFAGAAPETVEAGTVWRSVTHYEIKPLS